MRALRPLLAIFVLVAGQAARAQDPAGLELPGTPVATVHEGGTDAFFSIELQGVGAAFDVADGLYAGWSLEDSGLPNPEAATLLSSYDPALPAELTTCAGGPCAGATLPWDKLNYLLNNRRGGREDVQAAVWLLMWGRSTSIAATEQTREMLHDVEANGAGFVPGVGQVVAVILYTQDSFGLGWHGIQESVIEVPFELLACLVTAGAKGTSGATSEGDWDGTFARKRTRNRTAQTVNDFQFGGSVESSNGERPSDAWCHENRSGPDGRFTFDAGGSLEGTWVGNVGCSDPGFCFPSLPAPGKQIDLQGVGVFRDLSDPSPALAGVIPGETFHWFTVHSEDLGEPGTVGRDGFDPQLCSAGGASGGTADCGCPDFYHITIYRGFDPDTEPPNTTDVIYEERGYITTGNIQLHPPRG